ncbi:NAD(P)/FAD-dependent oxidoreductase [Nocardioides sp. CFH 31398]|uniref:NAD(P)/FAD-dependent oxidoreductase n=1 Tax=Nocardioides sp. CFH 31398 TaxID=2919579 RepID=UPI001F05284F|nr:monooxygenase [Nocardioides sp. CFH 31398]MCH1868026.1 monooxygenase [Nocardioides sp. CFH 31398]
MRDLVVAGGGPVGLATALHAARAGLDVEVREPRAGVVDKACGEGLMPGAVAALADLGVDPPGVDLLGIRYRGGGTEARADFRAGPGRGVRRTTLHAALRDAVAAAGIPVVERRVRTVENAADHVLVDSEPVRHLVAADGLHSAVRRLTGLEAPRGRTPRRYGQRLHLVAPPWSSHVEVHWSAVGEAYVTPVAPDLVGVAVLTTDRRPLAALLPFFGELAERVATAEAGPVRGAGPLRQRTRARVAGRVLLVGDAAGYVDALTGEGLALGLAQAEAAVAAVAADRPASYERTWRRLTRRHDLLTAGLLTATRPAPVRTRIVPAARRLPWAFDWAVDQLARPA